VSISTPRVEAAPGVSLIAGPARVADVGRVDAAVPDRVAELVGLAPRGLAAAYQPGSGEFAQTVRGTVVDGHRRIAAEGANLRYAAIAALGLHRLPEDEQRSVLHNQTAEAVVASALARAETSTDPGAVAVTAWAAAEVTGVRSASLFARLAAFLDGPAPLPAVDVSWMVTAAAAAAPYGETRDVLDRGRQLLIRHQGAEGLYPHLLAGRREAGWRGHVGSFADQVYPLQALARAAALTGDRYSLAAANRTAARICDLQGADGQWWWWYDARTGEVVERFPVYSVHQHAMAPMVLMDLFEAGGDDHRDEVALGLSWLWSPAEADLALIDAEAGLVWRKIGRREPRKAARALAAATTGVRPGWHLPGVDRLLPVGVVDHECRPYELGWLLYAWLGSPFSEPELRDD
jgi:hypothetical protein